MLITVKLYTLHLNVTVKNSTSLTWHHLYNLSAISDQHFSKRGFWKRTVTHHNRQHQYAMLGDETIRCHGKQFILKRVVWNKTKLLIFNIRQWPYVFELWKISCGSSRFNFTSWTIYCNAYIMIHNYTLLKILFIGLTLEYSILYSVHRHDLQTDSFHCADFLSPRHRNTDIRCCFVSQIPGGKLNPESWRSMLNTTTIQK